MGGGVGISRCRMDTGDAMERVGVIPAIDGSLKERATEGLLLAGETALASEKASRKPIWEVFRISLPESLMRGLNIAITCCKVEFSGVEAEETDNITFINAKLSSKDNWHSGQRGCLGDSW